MDYGGELLTGEEPAQHRLACPLGVRHAPGHACPEDPELGDGHAQRVGDRLDGVHGERGSPHDGGIELHGDDDHAGLRCSEVGVEREPLHSGAAVDDRDVVIPRAIVQGEAEPLLAQHQLVLVGQVDDGRDDGQVLDAGPISDVRNGGVLVEKLDGRLPVLGGPVVQAEVVGGGCLGIQVDEQDPQAARRVYGG